jgi:8-oxo-dGTP pyrophosphatase MutT (NUDIX family)
MLLEAAAGLPDDESPEDAVHREVEEELGVTVGEVEPVFDVWMSPGSVTERLHFFAGEDIEVVELDFDSALDMIDDGRIADAKTVMLLQWAALRGPPSGPDRRSRGGAPTANRNRLSPGGSGPAAPA